jgi:hypothetical protein
MQLSCHQDVLPDQGAWMIEKIKAALLAKEPA